ncbi:1,3-beta-glucanosyltransferase gel3 [Talaromyces proteolyticus]|uniref:1,3-beta-glucanosyltransferase n=1 Tax=Talaromyces proteolyticus TaxID=1131652 RepID=A0AAD4KHY8_9EURO|nr:1,3-beta-glucanosyltransferase gel3 [Talaromyces proteolyticus]KAH8692130.1 1,3-beta-glucanosyltransferase gel3 [Talaromyces proteolyticus]
MFFSTITGAALLAGSAVAANLPTIDIKGSKFFYSNNGTQFFLRGVAYQEPSPSTNTNGYIDPLATLSSCQRDIPYLQSLNTNTIRVYSVDPTQNHDDCMNAFADADIYVLVDLSAPNNGSINQNDPLWNTDLYSRYTAVIDNMNKYSNLLGFFAGNEVINSANTTAAASYVKAVVRDAKAYIKQKNYRSIGVGYAAADVSSIRVQLADYLNCGDESDSIDFFGDNVYEWCDPSTYTSSGYDQIVKNFSSYSVPYFFAEYGCLSPANGRTFKNIPTMYGDQMTGVLNGGVVFEYFEQTNKLGLVTLDGNSVSKLPDFKNFQTEIATVSPSPTPSSKYSPSNSAAACPTVDAVWAASSNLPPTPNEDLCNCMMSTLSCAVKSSFSSKSFAQLYSQLGGYKNKDVLAGVNHNSTSGVYGAYSMCSEIQKLSFAVNDYYNDQSDENKSSACDFGGAATSTTSSSPSGTCSSLLNEAASGTGTVTSAPSGTGGSGGGSGAATSSGLAMPMHSPSAMVVGAWQLAAYVAVAAFTGAGMILL